MAFQQGLSGLSAASKGLDVVGNNIANSGTVGFKRAEAHFADVYAASMSFGAASQVGIGVKVPTIMQQFTESNITTTNNPLDIAINGGGFFRVTRGDITAFTRNGQFHANKEGYIVNDSEFQLMGYPAINGVVVPSQPVPLQVDMSNMPPQPTGAAAGGDMRAVINLDSRSTVPTNSPFNPANPLTFTWSTATPVYDTLGVAHNMTFFFVRTPTDGVWDVHATLDGNNANVLPVATVAGANPLTFDTSGNLNSAAVVGLPTGFAVSTGAVTPIGTGLPNWNIDFTGSTSFGGTTTANKLTQGGYAQGAISGVSIAADGMVLGNYSNGQARTLGQVILVEFANPNGLLNMGNNLFQETSTSGTGLDGIPGAGPRGLLQSLAVEESNVDLTVELVNMITLQRAYQANAQTIKTQDQIMQTLVNLR